MEMAVIADSRRYTDDTPSFFNSYISMFSTEAEALHAIYQKCITRTISQKGRSSRFRVKYPIVAHRSLYRPTTGYFLVPLGHSSRGVARAKRHPAPTKGSLRACGYVFRHPDMNAPDRNVSSQLSDVAEMLSTSQDEAVQAELSDATLVLMPFHRPKFGLPDALAQYPGDETHATPGGCIFFIMRGRVKEDDNRLGSFLANVRWLLSEASASESQTAFEAEFQRREFAKTLVHGTVSAMEGVNVPAIINYLFKAGANKTNLSEKELAIEFEGHPSKVAKTKELLVRRLMKSKAAVTLAAALVGLAEIHGDEGRLRAKFLSDQPESLRCLAARAWDVATGPDAGPPSPLLALGSNDSGRDWTLPSGYVKPYFIEAIIVEMFRNAIQHGGEEGTERRVELSIFGTDEGVTIQVANDLLRGPRRAVRSGRFIDQMSKLLKDIDGMSLSIAAIEPRYVCVIELGKLRTLPNAAPPHHPGEVEVIPHPT